MQAEAENVVTSKAILGNSLQTLDAFKELYQLILENMQSHWEGETAVHIAVCQFLIACQYNLDQAMLQILRGHLMDSSLFTRKAIEFCAFAARVTKHPHLAATWMEAVKDEASWETYREKFGIKGLFPDDNATLKELFSEYDQASKSSHPSVFGIASHVTVKNTEDEFHLAFNYFDTDADGLRTEFLSTLIIHKSILKVLEDVFRNVLKKDKAQWESQKDAAFALLRANAQAWAAIRQTASSAPR